HTTAILSLHDALPTSLLLQPCVCHPINHDDRRYHEQREDEPEGVLHPLRSQVVRLGKPFSGEWTAGPFVDYLPLFVGLCPRKLLDRKSTRLNSVRSRM